MTLKARNRLIFIFLFITLIFLFSTLVLVIFAATQNQIVQPENYFRHIKLFNYSFTSVLISILCFCLYVPVILTYIIFRFEKTQTTELVFFMGFLFGCVAETVRIFIPLFSLWKTNSFFLLSIGHIVNSGRVIAPLSFFFATHFSATEQRQYVQRNFIILITTSAMVGFFVPLNTFVTTSTCTVLSGYKELFYTVLLLINAATLLSMILKSVFGKSSGEYFNLIIGYVVLMAGYFLLFLADSFFVLVPALVLLFAGTFEYLGSLHKMYMWH